MGKIIELDFKDIIPSQENLIKLDLGVFLLSYLKENSKKIIVPVASWKLNSSYKPLIDGHHRTSILYLLNKLDKNVKIYGWLTENNKDFIENLPKEFHREVGTITEMNGNINWRFNDVRDCPYSNLEELINQYPYMQSPELMLESFCSKKEIDKFNLNLVKKLVHN